MIYPLLPFFLTASLGAGPAILGTIEGAAESASSLVKLGSGWLSDRFRRRPLVIAGYGLAAVVRPVLSLVVAAWQVLALRLTDRFGKGIRTAPRDALIAESVDANRRATAFGIQRAADHLGAAIGPLFATALLLAWPGELRRVFAMAAVPGIIGALLVVWKVREQWPHVPESGTVTTTTRKLTRFDPAFLRYLGVLLIFALGNATDAFLLLRASELGVPLAAVPLLWSVHHVSKSLLSVPGGMLADGLGARRAVAGGWLIYAVVYAGFAFATATWHAWALFVAYGAFHALTEAPEKALVAALAPVGRQGAAFGAYHAIIGMAALPASILFGLLWARFGPATAFITGAALALSAAVLLPVTRMRGAPA
jgi:MFS family permease